MAWQVIELLDVLLFDMEPPDIDDPICAKAGTEKVKTAAVASEVRVTSFMGLSRCVFGLASGAVL
jgi:hypothetical protein